jgi:NADH-quinone oxidoreductase subunit N
MTVLLLAQAGVPLTSGFVAKFGVIQAAVEVHSYALAIIAMVASVIAAFLYLRIMVSMWITEPESDRRRSRVDPRARVDRRRS